MKLFLLFLILVCVPISSNAWNYQGHMTVAAIAYSQLSPNERQGIDTVLQSHPWYNKWLKEYQQAGSSFGIPFPTYAVMRAATWPDDIRGIPAYHHATWHYVNFPLSPPNSLNTTTSIGGDLLTQIEAALAVISTQPTTPAKKTERAIALSWLFHLIGDLHQPLHTGALRNAKYPQGDRGGNLFFVRATPTSEVVNLHSFWDGLIGQTRDVSLIIKVTNQIIKYNPPGSLTGSLGGNYKDWAAQSARLALENGYQFRSPSGVLIPIDGSTNENQGPPLPDGYQRNAWHIAVTQMALGGYHLGSMLSNVF